MGRVESNNFPRTLLKQSKEERYEYFKNYSVAHPKLARAFESLMQTILVPSGKELIFVIGPTGAGKTFLQQWCENSIKAHWASQQHLNPGRIPFAGILVPAKDTSKPTFTDIYLRLLRALEEPMIEKKIIYGDVVLNQTSDNKISISPSTRTYKYRYALEECCKRRKPFIVTLDEAQQLISIAGLSLIALGDWIKSFASTNEVLLGLFGTYEMFDILDLSDQATRRSKIIHIPRYTKSKENLEDFEDIILAFQENIPFAEVPDLMAHSTYIYERTMGCVGNLYNWLLGAVKLALDDDSDTLEYKHLRKTVLFTELQAQKIDTKITKSEERFKEKIGEEDPDIDAPKKPKKKGKIASSDTPASKPANKPPKRPKHVGRRNPNRDKTGRTSE